LQLQAMGWVSCENGTPGGMVIQLPTVVEIISTLARLAE